MIEWSSPLLLTPFEGGRGEMRMGLQPIDEKAWLQPSDEYELRIHHKQAMLQHHANRVICRLKDTFMIEQECLREIRNNLERYHSTHPITQSETFQYISSENHKIESCPLSLMARLLEEDICLLEQRDEQTVLVAGCVCTPSWWELSEKIGGSITQVHAPVNGLQEKIGHMIRHFLQNLQSDRIYQRANWAIWPTSRLCLFPNSIDIQAEFDQIPENQLGRKIFLRVERQTLRRLPETNAIVFTIKVFLSPLQELLHRPETATDLLKAIASLDDAERKYRRVELYEKKVQRYLSNVVD